MNEKDKQFGTLPSSVSICTPAIRFKGFESDWVNIALGEICSDTYGGGTPRTSDAKYWNGNTPWIQSSDLIEHQLIGVVPKKWVTGKGIKFSATKLVPKNSIAIVTRVGVGKLAFFPFEYATSQDFLSLSKLKIDHQFGVFSIWKKIQSELHEVQGTSIKGITKEELLAKLINIPLQPTEQTKIGSYFQQLDTLITQHQRKHDKLLNVKKAMLEKMFPKKGAEIPEIRFKGFSEKWEDKDLGDTKSYYTDGNYGESYPSEGDLSDSSNGIPFLRGSNLSCGQLSAKGANYITKEKHSELTSGTLVEDDIVIAVRGSLGAIGYVKKSNVGWNINSQLAIIRTDKKELKGVFLIQYLLSEAGQRKILSKISGSALKQLPIGQLKLINVPIASIGEQTKIGNLFKHLDTLLNLHQTELEKLKNIKKACLEKMFAE